MKRKRSIGQALSLSGTAVLSAGLLCNGLEIISNTVFRVIGLTGIAIELLALVFILKQKKF